MTPQTVSSRLFTCLYALIGVAFLGIALGIIGSNLINAQDRALAKAEQVSKHEILNMFGIGDDEQTATTDLEAEDQERRDSDGDVAIEHPGFIEHCLECDAS